MLSTTEFSTTEHAREERARRKAARQGLRVVKSRRRDPRCWDYGVYWLVSNENWLICSQYGLTLDDVEGWLE